MRSIVVVCALAGAAYAKPCPKDIAKKVALAYQSPEFEAARIQIRACVWGKFAGEGWAVYSVEPWPPGSKAETAPSGGIQFVDASGKLVASYQHGGVAGKVDARAIDLDGDGVDELVAVYGAADPLGPSHGDWLEVAHVTGKEIVVASEQISSGGIGVECKGKLADVRAVGKTKQLVVAVKEVSRPARDPNPDAPSPPECELGAGRHVFTYANGELAETK